MELVREQLMLFDVRSWRLFVGATRLVSWMFSFQHQEPEDQCNSTELTLEEVGKEADTSLCLEQYFPSLKT